IVVAAAWIAARALRRPDDRTMAAKVTCGLLFAAASSALYWLVPLPDVMCERRLYLPLVGAALSLSALVSRDRRRGRSLLVLVVLVLAPAMILRARVWSDPDRLWSEAARRSPRKARPLINLGVIAAEKGDTARADDLFGRAIALEPGNAEALFNRGKL